MDIKQFIEEIAEIMEVDPADLNLETDFRRGAAYRYIKQTDTVCAGNPAVAVKKFEG